jgi:hypothetical protein
MSLLLLFPSQAASLNASVDFAGIGTVNASGVRLLAASEAFSGVGSFAGSGVRLLAGSASYAGVGSLSAQAVRLLVASQSFAGAGSFAGSAVRRLVASESFGGTGSFSASAVRLLTVSLPLPGPALFGVGSFSAAGTLTSPQDLAAGVGFVGAGSFSGIPNDPDSQSQGGIVFGKIRRPAQTHFAHVHLVIPAPVVAVKPVYRAGKRKPQTVRASVGYVLGAGRFAATAVVESAIFIESDGGSEGGVRPSVDALLVPAVGHGIPEFNPPAERPDPPSDTPLEIPAVEELELAAQCLARDGVVGFIGRAVFTASGEIVSRDTSGKSVQVRTRPKYIPKGQSWSPEQEDADDDALLVAMLYSLVA